jgi:geranylgeranyl reductase family protein
MQKKKIYKLVIIGAGPTGCYLAKLLKEGGLEPLLIEEHKALGRPIHCAGLVGKRVFQEAKIPVSRDCILNTINGAVFHLDGDSFEVRRKEVAYVIDREKFDKNMGKGLPIIYETKFLGLEKNNNHYVIETDKGDLNSEIVIGADGANSCVRNIVRQHNSLSYMRGVQFRMQFQPVRRDTVEVYMQPPYFFWIIPEGENTVRVGVISQNPYKDLLRFIKERKMGNKILDKFAGTVPLEYFSPIARERIFLVGDSASQVKPLTYGGIYMGMRGAEMLSNCLIKEQFAHYSSLWIKRFGAELKISLRAREVFNDFAGKDIKRIFSFIKDKAKVIEEKGDFENHSIIAWELLKDPCASKELVSLLMKIIKAGFTGSSRQKK